MYVWTKTRKLRAWSREWTTLLPLCNRFSPFHFQSVDSEAVYFAL